MISFNIILKPVFPLALGLGTVLQFTLYLHHFNNYMKVILVTHTVLHCTPPRRACLQKLCLVSVFLFTPNLLHWIFTTITKNKHTRWTSHWEQVGLLLLYLDPESGPQLHGNLTLCFNEIDFTMDKMSPWLFEEVRPPNLQKLE